MPGTAARTEIIRLHRAIFERQRRLIAERVQGYSPEFVRYEARFRRTASSFLRPASIDELTQAATGSDIVFVGDYHTLKQAQRAYVKLVRRLANRGRPVVLALEFVEARSQPHVDRFLARHIGEREFLRRIDYRRHHVFDIWPHFRPVFDAAQGMGLPVVALDRARGGTLAERDRFAARRLADTLAQRPGALVLVLAGQLHCAPPHLPACLAREAARRGLAPLRPLVVYQNVDTVYWQLETAGLEHGTEAVLVRPGDGDPPCPEFCLVNTSPIVAQQSYLDWVESDGEMVSSSQPEQHFKELARVVCEFLDLEIGDALDHVEVYTAGDLSFLPALREGGLFTTAELALVRRQILARESYFIPRARIVYLAHLSLNHAAEEAAHFLRHVVTGEDEPQPGLIDGFYGRAMEEALAFFGSKIVNPRRKCPHDAEYERMRHSGDARERHLARLVMSHRAMERGERSWRVRKAFSGLDTEFFNAVTHALGYMLGDRLYYAMIRGLVSKEEARELFQTPLDEPGDPFHVYLTLASKLGRVRVPRYH